MALTVILYLAHSAAKDFVKFIRPPFDVLYQIVGMKSGLVPTKPAIDAILIIFPY